MSWIYVENYICPKITLPLSRKPQGREIAALEMLNILPYGRYGPGSALNLKISLSTLNLDALSHDFPFLLLVEHFLWFNFGEKSLELVG